MLLLGGVTPLLGALLDPIIGGGVIVLLMELLGGVTPIIRAIIRGGRSFIRGGFPYY